MYMKMKNILFIILTIFVINFNIDNVKAIDKSSCDGVDTACAICTYSQSNYYTIKFLVKSNGNSVSYVDNYTFSSKAPKIYSVISITNNDFISGDKIVCPSSIRYEAAELNKNNRLVFSFTTGDIKVSLNSSNSYNNEKNITKSISSNSSINHDKVSSSLPNNNTSTKQEGVSTSGCEILGTEFYEYLRAIFFWIQIFGPILALVLSMLDIAMAVAASDEDAKKKAIKKTPTRFIAAIILLLVPYLVEFILALVDDINGTTCGL